MECTRKLCRINGNSKAKFSRNRKIPYYNILLMALNKQGKNTSFEIRDFVINKKGESKVEYTSEAYLKQRRQLNPNVFREMNNVYLKDFYEDEEDIKRIKKYIVCAIDGSKEEIPNTRLNQEIFGYAGNNSDTKTARALLSGIYDINNHFFLNVDISRNDDSETEAAKRNIEEALKLISNKEILVVLDRGYPSIEFFNWLKNKEIKFVIRLSSNDYKKEKELMVSSDENIEIEHTKSRLTRIKKKHPEIIDTLREKKGTTVRFTKFKIGEKEECIVSNLSKEEFTSEEIKEIYKSRWEIEKSYDTIKNKLKIESFTGKLPIFIYQDIYAQIVVYNQIQDMLYTGNEEKPKTKKRKYEYKINENNAIGLYKEQYIKILLMEDKEDEQKALDELFEDMLT